MLWWNGKRALIVLYLAVAAMAVLVMLVILLGR
jgi:hypothetical protein